MKNKAKYGECDMATTDLTSRVASKAMQLKLFVSPCCVEDQTLVEAHVMACGNLTIF